MSIEITIIYSPESVNVVTPSYTFPEEGGTLGRGADNFWVLQDPNKYMSSVHAQIESLSGQYYLTDLSTNGTFMNGTAEPVGNGNQVILSEGDHFTISDYEFVVKISNGLNSPVFPASDGADPFASLSAPPHSDAPVNNDIFASADDGNDPFSGFNPEPSNNDPFSGFSSETSNNDPFSGFSPESNNNDPFSSSTRGSAIDEIMPAFDTEQQTDPLALLDKASTPANDPFSLNSHASSSFESPSFNHNEFSQNNFSEIPEPENNSVMNESIEWPTANQEASMIPDDWDDWDNDLSSDVAAPLPSFAENEAPSMTQNIIPDSPFDSAPAFSEAAAPVQVATQTPVPAQTAQTAQTSGHVIPPFDEPLNANIEPVHNPFDETSAYSPPPHQAIPETIAPAVSPVIPAVVAPQQQAPSGPTATEFADLERQNQQLRDEVNRLKDQLATAQTQRASRTTSGNDVAALDKVVDAMGLSKWNLDDAKKIEINETVGLLIRETMQGMMQVLKFRKKIKEEFRINVTTIQSIENNPLKFSANIDDALENMFIKENNAYKAPVDAVKEGFQGIAEHQVAVVAGMQAAFRGLIERFNPDNLESRFEKYKSTSLLSLGKTKRWNAYKEYHKGLTENIDDSFQHLFGYDFVQAYEEQMQSLISARVIANNNSHNEDSTTN